MPVNIKGIFMKVRHQDVARPDGQCCRNIINRFFSNPLLVGMVTILLFKPALISDIFHQFSLVYNAMAASCCCFIFYMAYIERHVSRMCIAVICFQGFIAVITLFTGGSVGEAFWNVAKVTSIYLFIEIGSKTSLEKLSLGMASVFIFYLIVNLITIICFPDGLYRSTETLNPCYFLGHRNLIFKVLLPGFALVGIYEVIRIGKVGTLTIFYYLGMAFTSVLVWSASSLVACAAIPLLFVFYSKSKRAVERAGFVSLLTGFMGTLAFPILRLQVYFSFIIVNILHKDLTLTDRATVWDAAIETISKSPVWGYGIENYEDQLSRFSSHVVSSHNYILDTLYYSGFTGLLLMVFTTCLVDKGLKGSHRQMAAIVSVCLTTAFILGIAEPYGAGLGYLIVLYALAYNCHEFSEGVREGRDS